MGGRKPRAAVPRESWEARRTRPGQLTEEAAAKPVPRAAHSVPHPAVPQARREGEGDAEQGHQQVAQAEVDQEEVGGRAQPRKLGVEQQHQQVAADAQQREAAEQQRQALVRRGAEERRGAPCARRRCALGARPVFPISLAAAAVPRVHGPTPAHYASEGSVSRRAAAANKVALALSRPLEPLCPGAAPGPPSPRAPEAPPSGG